jgi:hypothetical protein
MGKIKIYMEFSNHKKMLELDNMKHLYMPNNKQEEIIKIKWELTIEQVKLSQQLKRVTQINKDLHGGAEIK